MLIDTIVGRENEIDELNRVLRSPAAHLVGVTGRRRLGKTTLLESWAKTSAAPALFWTAIKRPARLLLKEFSQAVYQFEHGRPAPARQFSYESWDELFADLARICSRPERSIVIIDEFPYAVAADPALPSVLQNAWDHQLKRSNLVMVLCGSQMGMMSELYQSDAPLFGRIEGPMRVGPLPFSQIGAFMPGYNFDERVKAYACFGGVPAYLELIDPHISVYANIQQQVFSDFGIFSNDPDYLISEQVNDARYYNAILEAISQGARQSAEIASRAGFTPGTNPAYYLTRLCEMDYLRDAYSLEIEPLARKKSRKTHYLVNDAMLQFYFRFVQRYRGALNLDLRQVFNARLEEQLESFAGRTAFEEICRQWLRDRAQHNGLPFLIEDIGQIWGNDGENGTQVDAAAISWRDKCVLVGEAKWTTTHADAAVVNKLLRTTIPVVLSMLPNRGGGWTAYPYLFVRRGVTREAYNLARAAGVRIIAVGQIEDSLIEL